MTRPMSALRSGQFIKGSGLAGFQTYTGVGLPNVLRRSPRTTFWGDKYNFSKSSGEIETLLAVLIVCNAAARSAFGPTELSAPLEISFSKRSPEPAVLYCPVAMMMFWYIMISYDILETRVIRDRSGEKTEEMKSCNWRAFVHLRELAEICSLLRPPVLPRSAKQVNKPRHYLPLLITR